MAEDNPIEDFAWAVKTGDLNNVKNAVEQKKLSVNLVEAGVAKRTPMHWAADYGQVEVMKYLVSKKAKIDAADNFGLTPLISAVYEGHESAVEYLLSQGASTKIKTPDGQSIVDAAEKQSIKKLLQNAKS